MNCTLTQQSPQSIFNNVLSGFSNTVLGGGTVIPETNEWYVVSLLAAQRMEMQSMIAQHMSESSPETACCDNLVAMAALDGVYPRGAGFAQGYVKITGTAGAAIPASLIVSFGTSQFQAIGSIPSVMPANGEVTVLVKAVQPGVAGNTAAIDAGNNGTLVTPSAGLSNIVQAIGVNFCGGGAIESCEAFRSRYLARKRYQPRATQAWMLEKLKEYPCLTRVALRSGNCKDANCGCSCGDCQNEFEYYVFFDGLFPCGIAPQTAIEEVSNWMFGPVPGAGMGQVEVGICGKVYAAKAMPVKIFLTGPKCLAPNALSEIEIEVRKIFMQATPGVDLQDNMFKLAIAQILGATTPFGLSFEYTDPTGVIQRKCNVIGYCDYLPCFDSVSHEVASFEIEPAC